VLGRKPRSPEESAPPPPPPPTRCTESFDGLRPRVGGAGQRRGSRLRSAPPLAVPVTHIPHPLGTWDPAQK
jgi:hypothetical protein